MNRKIYEEGDVANHFDCRSAKYGKGKTWVHNESIMSMTFLFLNIEKQMKFIDIGAGTGAVVQSIMLNNPDLRKCVALDISKKMINHITDERITKHIQSVQSMGFEDQSFDVALCRQVLHYVNDLDESFKEIHRILKDNGRLVIAQITPFCEDDKEWWFKILKKRQPHRKHFLTLQDLTSALRVNEFSISRVAQMRAENSLKDLVGSYEDCGQKLREIWDLFDNAPSDYKKTHNYKYLNNDILYDNCWTFIEATKK